MKSFSDITPSFNFEDLLEDSDRADVLMGIARDPTTPAEVLREIAKDEDRVIREAVARNPNTPPDVLGELLRSL